MSVARKFCFGQSNGVGEEQLYGFSRLKDFIQVYPNDIYVPFSLPVQSGIVVVHNTFDGGLAPFTLLGQVKTSVELFPEAFCKRRFFIGICMIPIVEIEGGKSLVRS